jgi:hypothetical protein
MGDLDQEAAKTRNSATEAAGPWTIECEFLSRDKSIVDLPGKCASLGGSRFGGQNVVAFLLSFVLFIGLCGFLDSRLSWPLRPTRGRK